MGAWEDGFGAGYRKGIEDARRDIGRDLGSTTSRTKMLKTPARRKSSLCVLQAVRKRSNAGSEIKRIGWMEENGFKRCSAAARRAAKNE